MSVDIYICLSFCRMDGPSTSDAHQPLVPSFFKAVGSKKTVNPTLLKKLQAASKKYSDDEESEFADYDTDDEISNVSSKQKSVPRKRKKNPDSSKASDSGEDSDDTVKILLKPL